MRGLPRHAELSRISARHRFVPHRVAVGALCLLVAAGGCGPIEYLSTVPFDAARALSEAKQLDADRYAPYEITAAEQYIHKSRQLAGYARYQSAIAFGDKAGENARKAQKLALDKSRLPEERIEAPVNGEPSISEVKTTEVKGAETGGARPVTPPPAAAPPPPPPAAAPPPASPPKPAAPPPPAPKPAAPPPPAPKPAAPPPPAPKPAAAAPPAPTAPPSGSPSGPR